MDRLLPTVCRRLYTGGASSGSNLFTYTFSSGFTFGPARKHDVIVCVFSASASSDISPNSVTVGGVAATKLVEAKTTTGATFSSSIWLARDVPVTSGNIVVDWSAEMGRCAVAAYGLYNLQSATPVGTATNLLLVAGTSNLVQLPVSRGGLIIGAVYSSNNTSPVISWSGLDVDLTTTIESFRYSAASREFASDVALHDVTVTSSGAINTYLAAVSLR